MSIFIHHGTVQLEIHSSPHVDHEPTDQQIEDCIVALRNLHTPLHRLDTAQPETTLSKIQAQFDWIEAAGGVIQTSDDRYLLIHRRGYLDLPKGKIDPGETPIVTAIREIEEETGLTDLELVSPLSPTYHIYSLAENWILKKTHWFHFTLAKEQPLRLQTEEDIDEGKWMHPDQIKKSWTLIYPSLHPLLEGFIA